ncbi:MAG: hypothetical protein HYZ54_07210 [Ignavibacteriae bacterium]|nr:hypothetical protein [Ignavibacteriota bacterium]
MNSPLSSSEIRHLFEAAVLSGDKAKLKILVAINSDKNNKMIEDDIKNLTGIEKNDLMKSIEFLSEAHYIETMMEDIPGRSPHKVCILTEDGKKILGIFGVED